MTHPSAGHKSARLWQLLSNPNGAGVEPNSLATWLVLFLELAPLFCVFYKQNHKEHVLVDIILARIVKLTLQGTKQGDVWNFA